MSAQLFWNVQNKRTWPPSINQLTASAVCAHHCSGRHHHSLSLLCCLHLIIHKTTNKAQLCSSCDAKISRNICMTLDPLQLYETSVQHLTSQAWGEQHKCTSVLQSEVWCQWGWHDASVVLFCESPQSKHI